MLFSCFVSEPGASSGHGGKKTQKSSSPLRRQREPTWNVQKVYKGRRWKWYKVILITESVRYKWKDSRSTALCDQMEALQSQGVATVHWRRLALCLPQWSNYRTSCYHILPITNVLSRTQRLIFSFYPSIRVWLIRRRALESKTHPIDFFLVYIFTHTLMQLGAQSSMVSALLGALQCSPLQ